MKRYYDEYLKRLIEVNNETKSIDEHNKAIENLAAWEKDIKAKTGFFFSGDRYYKEKFDNGELEHRPMSRGVFLDWKCKAEKLSKVA